MLNATIRDMCLIYPRFSETCIYKQNQTHTILSLQKFKSCYIYQQSAGRFRLRNIFNWINYSTILLIYMFVTNCEIHYLFKQILTFSYLYIIIKASAITKPI